MLSLTSPRWNELYHAYGSAEDTPQFLQLLLDGEVDFHSEAYNSLCHQQSVYPATMAAAPHLLEYARSAAPLDQYEVVVFLGEVHAHRSKYAIADTPGDVLIWYTAIIPAARELAIEIFLKRGDDDRAVELLEKIAALQGLRTCGQMLGILIQGDGSTFKCPGCRKYVFATRKVGEETFTLMRYHCGPNRPDGPEQDGPQTAVVPQKPATSVVTEFKRSNAFEWLCHLCVRAGCIDLARSLEPLFGSCICPNCDSRFNLMDEELADY